MSAYRRVWLTSTVLVASRSTQIILCFKDLFINKYNNYLFTSVLVFHRCQDYILIESGLSETSEFCGNTTATTLELQTGTFTVYFRTSEEGRGRGFEMYVVCFNPEHREFPFAGNN